MDTRNLAAALTSIRANVPIIVEEERAQLDPRRRVVLISWLERTRGAAVGNESARASHLLSGWMDQREVYELARIIGSIERSADRLEGIRRGRIPSVLSSREATEFMRVHMRR